MCTIILDESSDTQQVGLRLPSIWVNALKAKALYESVNRGKTILYTDLIREAIQEAYKFS